MSGGCSLSGEDSGDVFFVSGEDRAWKLQVVDVVEVQGWSVSGCSFARCCCVVERRDGDLLSFRGCCLGSWRRSWRSDW